MRKTKIIILCGLAAAGFLAVTNFALADGEWTTISGTSNIYNTNLGMVGIGTTSPATKFDVKASTGNIIARFRGGNAAGIYPSGAGGLYFSENFSNGLAEEDIWSTYDPASYPSTGIRFLQMLTPSTYRDLMFLSNTGNIGIGTTNPGAKLTVTNNAAALPAPITNTTVQIGQADATGNLLLLDSFGAGGGFIGRRANGTNANKTNLLNGQGLANMLGYGYGATGYSGTPRAAITFFTAQDWTDTAQGSLITFKITPNNSTTLTEAMRIDNTGNIGIGTNSPSTKLDVYGGTLGTAQGNMVNLSKLYGMDGTSNTHYLKTYLNRYIAGDSHNTAEIRLQEIIDSTNRSFIAFRSGDSVNYFPGLALGFGNSDSIWIDYSGKIGIGTTHPQSTLAVNGTITTKKIKVTETGWSDFVFEEGYKLPTLMAVESHIKQYKHLPGIPSAQEIKQKGLDVSDVLAKQMQKIEELTLYIIDLQKQIEELKKK